MADSDFSTLDQLFTMFSPADLAGKVQPDLGGPLSKVNNVFAQLLLVLENSGRGVFNAADLKQHLTQLTTNSQLGNIDLSQYLSFYSTQGFIDGLGPGVADSKKYQSATGTKSISGIQEVIGRNFQLPSTRQPLDVSIVLSRSPFFNPSTRNAKKAEVFLNSMPPVVLGQLQPYMQVEFQMTRDPSPKLQTAGRLKFLLGAADKQTVSDPDNAMIQGHQVTANGVELDFAGMEMFTSPQTMVNPQPNKSVGTDGVRYAAVLDPFRPFASLEHVSINSVPAVGMFSYKKATMTLKVHDRSRLSEISDLIRPRTYTGVTVWLTYGWRAPVHPGSNPYFDYVNNNMLMREAYGIVNSNFSFDDVGQVVLTLELFTKGVNELRQLRISDNNNDMGFRFKQLKQLEEQISTYRQRLKLDPPEGINREVRAFQVLDAAEKGEFPDLSADQLTKTIDSLREALGKTAGVDKEALSGLITSLRKLYTPNVNDPNKFSFKERLATTVTMTIKEMFDEAQQGPDPFLPIPAKATVGAELAQAVAAYNKAPATKVPVFRNTLVSFGKLFSVFALRAITSADVVDEVQVFFYNLNEQCGPISSHSVAEFPIEMPVFLDQYREHVMQKAGENVTLEEFLQLLINAQFLDNRAVGYGLRQFYEPYDPKSREAQVRKDRQANFESQLARYSNQYGPFKKPVIEMTIEVSHERVSEAGDSDVLQLLSYSAKDAKALDFSDLQQKALRRIMRIHVYDKQTNPNRAAKQLLRNEAGSAFIEVPSTDYARKFTFDTQLGDGFFQQAVGAELQQDVAAGTVRLVQVTTNQQIKEIVSKLVPTIRYGSNGSTVTSAKLASKVDPLLSTVQMIRSMTVRNNASPNGSGETGIPLRVIPAQLQMTTLGNPLATMAQQYFFDASTGTTLDNLYIVTGLTHTFSPGKFETAWQLGYSDGYGTFEGAPSIVKQVASLSSVVPKDPTNPR